MNVHYIVELTDGEREELQQFLAAGTKKVRTAKRAQILLACDQQVPDATIAKTVATSTSTIYRIKRRFGEEGLQQALSEQKRPGGKRKLSGREEAKQDVIMTALVPSPLIDLVSDTATRPTAEMRASPRTS